MSMQLSIFKYKEDEEHFNDLTAIDIDGEPWFIAKEVCDMLDIKNSREAVSNLDEDEKNTVAFTDGTSGNPNKTIVSESGLYALVFRSKKPTAKKFRQWITKEVIPSIRKTGKYGAGTELKSFAIRYNDNWERIDKGYFSVISELYVRLYAKFEMTAGYVIPDTAFESEKEIRPDVSVGRMFADYLRKKHPELSNEFKYYNHLFRKSNIEVEARQYKNSVLETFIKFIDDEWLPKQAYIYFKKRDPIALDHLPKLLGGSDYQDAKPKQKEIELSDFDKKLLKAVTYNPKENKK